MSVYVKDVVTVRESKEQTDFMYQVTDMNGFGLVKEESG